MSKVVNIAFLWLELCMLMRIIVTWSQYRILFLFSVWSNLKTLNFSVKTWSGFLGLRQ